jgi:hypothetical protein
MCACVQIVRKVAAAHALSELQNASLFALVNAAMADAGTLCWQQKYKSYYRRPAVGMQDTFPGWMPLGAPNSNTTGNASASFTPSFPAYPSGHATFGAAALHAVRLFFGQTNDSSDNPVGVKVGDRGRDTVFQGLTFVSDELDGRTIGADGTPRKRVPRGYFGSLWDMIFDNGMSRVFLGWVSLPNSNVNNSAVTLRENGVTGAVIGRDTQLRGYELSPAYMPACTHSRHGMHGQRSTSKAPCVGPRCVLQELYLALLSIYVHACILLLRTPPRTPSIRTYLAPPLEWHAWPALRCMLHHAACTGASTPSPSTRPQMATAVPPTSPRPETTSSAACRWD